MENWLFNGGWGLHAADVGTSHSAARLRDLARQWPGRWHGRRTLARGRARGAVGAERARSRGWRVSKGAEADAAQPRRCTTPRQVDQSARQILKPGKAHSDGAAQRLGVTVESRLRACFSFRATRRR